MPCAAAPHAPIAIPERGAAPSAPPIAIGARGGAPQSASIAIGGPEQATSSGSGRRPLIESGRTVVYAEGGNYRIEVVGAIATCTVWKRPDVTSQQGASWAEETVGHFYSLCRTVRAMVFDLSDAPPVIGPVTQEAIGRMLAAFEAAGRPIALVCSHPTQRLQLRRLIESHAPTRGELLGGEPDARKWSAKQAIAR